jgi:hypothetical protein
VELPLPWGKLCDTSSGILADALQDIDQIGVDVAATIPQALMLPIQRKRLPNSPFGGV